MSLERRNAHTRFAYEVVRKECRNVLAFRCLAGHEHAHNPEICVWKRQSTAQQLGYCALPILWSKRSSTKGFLERKARPIHLRSGRDEVLPQREAGVRSEA